MKKILFTGFEPFGKESVNPSWAAVSMLPDTLDDIQLLKCHLPVEYDRAAELLFDEIRRMQPDAVICVGQGGGRAALTPELVAINYDDAPDPDNAGVQRTDRTICPDGPAAYFSTIPVKQIIAAIRAAGVPAILSCSAGTYVCNNLMYHLLHGLAQEFPHIWGGFIHVPFECSQTLDRGRMPSLPISAIAAGLEAAARAVAENL